MVFLLQVPPWKEQGPRGASNPGSDFSWLDDLEQVTTSKFQNSYL